MFNKKLKKFGIATIIVLMMVFLTATILPDQLQAAGSNPAHNETTLEKGQTLNRLGFFSGDLVQVDGTVEGTTFATGQEVRINGVINGDLFVAAKTISISGKVNGNIYAGGQNLIIGTQSSGDVFVAGQMIDIAKEAVIGRDLFGGGQKLLLNGAVERHFSGAGSNVIIGGSIGQNVNMDGGNITLLDGATIKGNLSYKSPNQANIATGSNIGGVTDWQYTKPVSKQEKHPTANFFGSLLLSIASALLIWFIAKIWRPDFWSGFAGSIAEQPLKTIGIGVLAFLLTPLLIILLMITVIGIPLGIILGLVFGITLYLSKIIAAVFIDSWLTKRFGWTERHKGVWPVLLGLVLLALLIKVPILGFVIWLLVVFAGLGSLILSKYKVSENTDTL